MFTVAPHYQIMEQLGLKDLSRKLVTMCAISYFLSLYLILHVGIQTFDVTGCKNLRWDLNMPCINECLSECQTSIGANAQLA